jgi:hypothetical protein
VVNKDLSINRHRRTEDLTEDEWRIVEQRARRRELATEDEVEAVFGRYRNPKGRKQGEEHAWPPCHISAIMNR